MSDYVLSLVSDWGAWALTIVTFLSCLAIPVPSSMMMLSAGAFAATGDMELIPAAAGALIGAVLGDQTGYQLGRVGFQRAEGWLIRSRTRASVLERARASVHKGGGVAVFFSRWMFSVLGPYVNLIAGAAGMTWLTFTVMGIAGEIVWVVTYVGLGYMAGGQLSQASEMLTNALGLAGSLVVTIGLGWMLIQRRRKRRAAAARA
ncbi:DedA family protein [Pararhodobacter sp. CCB-MM2]|uniref:DedA family protein n=1 Tax=Pararhodobacter sp. CCB-MM2 TaxID=1786003 RepID=UPI0008319ABB|nr:DedA family protein [Pararhodobacter sp. CCB-MM2]